MRISRIGPVVLLLVLLMASGCQSTRTAPQTSPATPRIEQGMSPSEVRAIMGTPRQMVEANGTVQWMVYGTSSQQFLIYFRNGEVVAAPRRVGPSSALNTS